MNRPSLGRVYLTILKVKEEYFRQYLDVAAIEQLQQWLASPAICYF